MNAFIAICILVSLPMSMGLKCYYCLPSTAGCNDPFNKTGSGVSETVEISTNKYCTKLVAAGTVTRSGAPSCTAAGIHADSSLVCCQANLCNGARANNQMPIMLIIGLIAILAKIQWI